METTIIIILTLLLILQGREIELRRRHGGAVDRLEGQLDILRLVKHKLKLRWNGLTQEFETIEKKK